MDDKPNYPEVRDRLNAVSPSFCLAKWLQVTIHLHNGQTHSCHHPNTHTVPLDELVDNPSALHNTKFKKQQRKMMLESQRPTECQYCWNIEDLPGGHISDRTIKSSDEWALPHLDKIKNQSFDQNVNPPYLEVSFSNACNFKCSYCYPHFSSRLMNEIKEHGHYQLHYPQHQLDFLRAQGKMPYDREEANPYVDAFWRWWPSLYPDLKVLRVTGGEPLLSPSTFRLLDEIIKNPNPEMELAINSNLGSAPAIIDRFFEKANYIVKNKMVKRLRLYTSVDTWGVQAEYIRHGLDFQSYWSNLERAIRDLPEMHTTIMCTFNNLSVPSYQQLLEGYLALKRKYRTVEDQYSFILDIAYLQHPVHQSVLLLPKKYLEIKLEECSKLIQENMADHKEGRVGFSEYEKIKFNRVKEFALTGQLQDREKFMGDFYLFFSEHDRRRNTSLLSAFPELAQFWRHCQGIATNSQKPAEP